jgi:hypothetical protein
VTRLGRVALLVPGRHPGRVWTPSETVCLARDPIRLRPGCPPPTRTSASRRPRSGLPVARSCGPRSGAAPTGKGGPSCLPRGPPPVPDCPCPRACRSGLSVVRDERPGLGAERARRHRRLLRTSPGAGRLALGLGLQAHEVAFERARVGRARPRPTAVGRGRPPGTSARCAAGPRRPRGRPCRRDGTPPSPRSGGPPRRGGPGSTASVCARCAAGILATSARMRGSSSARRAAVSTAQPPTGSAASAAPPIRTAGRRSAAASGGCSRRCRTIAMLGSPGGAPRPLPTVTLIRLYGGERAAPSPPQGGAGHRLTVPKACSRQRMT